MATHSRILAWRIPWTEEPGGLQSIGSQTAGHDQSDLARCTGWKIIKRQDYECHSAETFCLLFIMNDPWCGKGPW